MSLISGRITLIIPCYNAVAYIGDALDSALSQSVRPDEIIVVDDGSTDGSAAAIARFGDSVRCIRQDNQGDPSARNLGLAHATGTLMAFLDADDLWPVDSLATRMQALGDSAFVWGITEQFVSEDSERTGTGAAIPSISAPIPGATLFQRAVFEQVGGFDTRHRLGAMMDWYSRALHCGFRGMPIQSVVLRRRIHDTNSVHDSARLMGDYLRVLRSAARRNRGAPE
jgi:glycosyltransferase involved in cell wall biosynthesis